MNDYRNNEWTRAGAPTPAPDGATAPPGTARPLAQPLSGRRVPRRSSGHRHSSSSSRRKLKRMRLFAVVLLIALVATAMAGVMVFFKMKQYRGDTQQLTIDLRRAEGELARARERLTEMNNDLRILLANRIPGVAELITNRQLEINDQYVRNITFVQSGVGDDQTIEFSAVLQNTRQGPILPKVDVVLFDESGLQTGAVHLSKSQTVTPADLPELQPGETRTYSGQIQLQRQAPSKYFVVDVN